MDLLIADIWPGMECSVSEGVESVPRAQTSLPLAYPQYVALLLHAGLRAGVSSSTIHHVFQLTGQWELEDPLLSLDDESSRGKLIARLVSEGNQAEEHDNSDAVVVDEHIKTIIGTSEGNVTRCGASSVVRFRPEAFFCAHLSRESAELFIEKPSSLPAFHYLKKPLTTDVLLSNDLGPPESACPDNFIPLDCLFCLQKQLFSVENQKRKSKHPITVVNTLYSPKGLSSIKKDDLGGNAAPQRETVAEHYQIHQRRCQKYLAMLEGEEVAYLGESGDEFELDSETGRDACEINAEEEGRHACFLCAAGSSTCPVAVCYCAACNIFAPLTRFSSPDLTSPFDDSDVEHEKKNCQPGDPSLWISSDSISTIVARLLLAFHVLLEAQPNLILTPKREEQGNVTVGLYSGHAENEGDVKECISSPSLVSCTEGDSYRIGDDDIPAVRTPYLFFQTPLIFQDPPTTVDLEEHVDGECSRGAITSKFEEEIEEMVSAEAVLPGAKWILYSNQQHHGDVELAEEEGKDEKFFLSLRMQSSLKEVKLPLLDYFPFSVNTEEWLVEKGNSDDANVETDGSGPSHDAMMLAHDVVVGLLVSFGDPVKLGRCVTNVLLPQIEAESSNKKVGEGVAESNHIFLSSASAHYSRLPDLLSYRHVYIPEEEKWVEALVLHHHWYNATSETENNGINSTPEPIEGEAHFWLGETPDGFRRAFLSYPILVPGSTPLEHFLPSSMVPLVKKNITSDAHNEIQTVDEPVTTAETASSPFGAHPFSVEAKRLEFLLGITALAKAIHNLLPMLTEGNQSTQREDDSS